MVVRELSLHILSKYSKILKEDWHAPKGSHRGQ